MRHTVTLLFLVLALSACERLGIPDPTKEAARKEEESKAIGAACRQSGRALEDCFTLNPSAEKASVFSGWREMNDYMMQNKLDVVKPEFTPMGTLRKRPGEGDAARADTAPTDASAAAMAAPGDSASSVSSTPRRRPLISSRPNPPVAGKP